MDSDSSLHWTNGAGHGPAGRPTAMIYSRREEKEVVAKQTPSEIIKVDKERESSENDGKNKCA